MPDLIASRLTGGAYIGAELTVASTSQMIDPEPEDWNLDLLKGQEYQRTSCRPLSRPELKSGKRRQARQFSRPLVTIPGPRSRLCRPRQTKYGRFYPLVPGPFLE